MTLAGWAQIIIFLVVLTALTPLLGAYTARVYQGGEVRAYRGPQVWLARVGAPVERLLSRLLRVAPEKEQDWKEYARSVLLFSLASWLVLYLALRTQGSDPFNPQHFASGPWDLSFNTASSFVSNTSWQYYAGRIDPVLLLADGRHHRGQLHVLRRRHGRGRRADPGTGPAGDRPARQLLGRPDPHAALRLAPALDPRRPVPRLARGAPEPGALPAVKRPDPRRPDDRDGAGGIAGGDQAAVSSRRC